MILYENHISKMVNLRMTLNSVSIVMFRSCLFMVGVGKCNNIGVKSMEYRLGICLFLRFQWCLESNRCSTPLQFYKGEIYPHFSKSNLEMKTLLWLQIIKLALNSQLLRVFKCKISFWKIRSGLHLYKVCTVVLDTSLSDAQHSPQNPCRWGRSFYFRTVAGNGL